MKEKTIESTSNPIVKRAAALHMRKNRKKYQQFLLEGIRGIQDTLSASKQIECVFYESKIDSVPGGTDILQQIRTSKIELYKVTSEVMKKIADTKNPQGLMAVVRIPDHNLSDLLENSQYILMLDKIQDPGNMGTLIRSAEASGFDGILLTGGSTDPYSSKCIRAATGAVSHIPVIELNNTEDVLEIMKEKKFQILGAALENGISYTTVKYEAPLALLIGNEASGIHPDLLAMVAQRITIPMRGKTQSLNAAVAGSVLMFHITDSCR